MEKLARNRRSLPQGYVSQVSKIGLLAEALPYLVVRVSKAIRGGVRASKAIRGWWVL